MKRVVSLPRVWFVQRDVVVTLSSYLTPAHHELVMAAERVAASLPAWLAEVSSRRELTSIYHELAGGAVGDHRAHQWDRRALAEWLASAFRGGLLSALEVPRHHHAEPGSKPKQPSTHPPPPPKPKEGLTWLWLEVLDDVSEPIAGLQMRCQVDGEQRMLVTDAAGQIRIDPVEGAMGHAVVASLQQLVDIVTPRWTAPREPVLKEGPHVTVAQLGADIAATLVHEELVTLHVTPRFTCRGVHGTRFAFARSFVTAGAEADLAPIAEELHQNDGQQAMIFGHTDLVGGELANKELSERRAKAVRALLTHDHEAWGQMWNGLGGIHWYEKWGTYEVQHMLNALGCRDDDGLPLDEDSGYGSRTHQAVTRFQLGDYPQKPPEQEPLTPSGMVDAATRTELFLAYAKRITRHPVDGGRIVSINGDPYMGCGEFNPLTPSMKDAESRRTVVFIFDPAATPTDLPCKLGTVAPCYAAPLGALDPEISPPNRCPKYVAVAKHCKAVGGADLSHDLIVRFAMGFDAVTALTHELVVRSEDGTFEQRRRLAGDARATPDGRAEIYYTDLPATLRYDMHCEAVPQPTEVLPTTKYEDLSELGGKVEEPLAPSIMPFLLGGVTMDAPEPNA